LSPSFQKIDKALNGEPIEETIPALAKYLAGAGVSSGVSRRVFSAYVLEMIDNEYDNHERQEK
jgi:hypothetical protein